MKYLYVYILKCSDGSYYTGVTNNPERRLEEHNFGINKDAYTYSRRALELVYRERFDDFNLAISWEKRIKKWSRKKKKR
ncbi:MAG: GIY-YIG nuclease family protein [Bacteroidota bacterium]